MKYLSTIFFILGFIFTIFGNRFDILFYILSLMVWARMWSIDIINYIHKSTKGEKKR